MTSRENTGVDIMRLCLSAVRHVLRCAVLCAVLTFSLSPAAVAQGTLDIKRMHVQWPDVHVYYTARCAGAIQYGISSSQIDVSVDGLPRSVTAHGCADPTIACPMSVALVGDASGSMAGAGNAGLKTAFNLFIDSLSAQDEAAVLYFNTSVTTAQTMTADTALLHAAINSIPATGGTAAWDGFKAGVQEVIANGSGSCRSVILLTDGMDNSSTHTPNEVIGLAADNRVHLFSVGLGTSIDTTVLSMTARLTGGRFRQISSVAQLPAVLAEFMQFMRDGFEECALTLQPGCPDGGVHTVQLQIGGVCGGTVRDSATYRAPLDTASFADMDMRLDSVLVAGATEFDLPLRLVTPLSGEHFEALEFSIAFNTAFIELQNVSLSPGSLLANATVSYTPTAQGADVSVSGPSLVSGSGPLLDFRFRSIAIPSDTICADVMISGAQFDAGCYRPVMRSGTVCIRPGTPVISCDMTGDDHLVWDKAAQDYAPRPFAVTMKLENSGDGGATGLRYRITFDTTDVRLVSPAVDTLVASPSVLLPGGQNQATWQLAARPRSSGDSITLSITALFDNAPPVTCMQRVWVPAAALTLKCVIDVPQISVDADNIRYQPMPFPVTVTVHNQENTVMNNVRARIVLPAQLTLAGADAPDRFVKDVLPRTLQPQQSGMAQWMVTHPLINYERGYIVDVWVYADNADSSLCQAVVTIPAIDAPKLSPRCYVPDSLHYDAQLDSYVPNPFTVKLTCVNNGQLPAANVLGTLLLPPDVELVNAVEPLTKSFNPSFLRPWAIGDPIPELTWSVRYTKRAHAPVCPEFVFLVTGESTKGVPLDTVRVSCCVPVKPIIPQWACALEIPDSLGLNVSGTAVEPNPFTVRYTITNSGQRAGIIRRVRFPLPLQDGISLLPSSPMGLDDSVDVTIGPNATASFEWLVSVRDRITRRDLQLQVTAWDDAGDPISCADNLPIAAVRQQLVCSGIDLPKEICAEGATFFVTVTLRNSGSVNINSPSVLLEWTDVGGAQYVAFDPAWPDSMNPKSRGVIFPGQELEFRWFFRTIARNTGSAPVQVHYSVRFSGDGIPTQDGGPNCVGTVTILPSQFHPINVIGSLTPCEGDTVLLDAGGGYMNYWWSTQKDSLRHLAVTRSGEYRVIRYMTQVPYCPVFSDTVRVTFNPRPATPLITRNGNTLTASAASSWQWLREGNAIPGATAQSYTVTQDGSYSVVVTNAHGCSAMSDTTHVTLLSAGVPADPRLRIAVFPNPAPDVFTVSVEGARTQRLSLRVTDMLGREVLRRDIYFEGIRQRLRVDLSGRAAGVYFLHVDGADRRETRLLMLQRE
jgi:hypothetical protein